MSYKTDPDRGALNADDAAWFEAHPHRQFRCRNLDDGTAGPRLKVKAKINPAFLAEVGLPERQS